MLLITTLKMGSNGVQSELAHLVAAASAPLVALRIDSKAVRKGEAGGRVVPK